MCRVCMSKCHVYVGHVYAKVLTHIRLTRIRDTYPTILVAHTRHDVIIFRSKCHVYVTSPITYALYNVFVSVTLVVLGNTPDLVC